MRQPYLTLYLSVSGEVVKGECEESRRRGLAIQFRLIMPSTVHRKRVISKQVARHINRGEPPHMRHETGDMCV